MRLVEQLTGTFTTRLAGVATPSGQWTVLSYLGAPYCQYTLSEIDLSGLTIQEQTFFPVSAMIQGNQLFAATNFVPGDQVTDTVVVSTTPLSDSDMRQASVGFLPGMDWSLDLTPDIEDQGQDLQNIVFGQHRTWVYNVTTDPYLSLIGQDNFGTNNGIASGRLYVYRITSLPPDDGKTLLTHPTAVVITGAAAEEEDLVRLMRMKRNTRLQS